MLDSYSDDRYLGNGTVAVIIGVSCGGGMIVMDYSQNTYPRVNSWSVFVTEQVRLARQVGLVRVGVQMSPANNANPGINP